MGGQQLQGVVTTGGAFGQEDFRESSRPWGDVSWMPGEPIPGPPGGRVGDDSEEFGRWKQGEVCQEITEVETPRRTFHTDHPRIALGWLLRAGLGFCVQLRSTPMSSRIESRRSSSGGPGRQREWRFNWKLLAALVVVPLLLVGLGFLSHRLFLDRNLSALWERAQADRADGNMQEAFTKSQLYLSQRPDDSAVLRELAVWYRDGNLRVGQALPVYRMLTEAARRNPSDTELAQAGFDMAMQLVEEARPEERSAVFTEARQIHFAAMPQSKQLEPANRARLGLCHAGLGDLDLAATEWLAVIESGFREERPFLDLAELVNLSNPARGEQSTELKAEVRKEILRVFEATNIATVQGETSWTPLQRRRVTDRILQKMETQVEPAWRAVLAQSQWASRRGDLDRAEALAQQAMRQSDRSAETMLWLVSVELQRAVAAEKQGKFLGAENSKSAVRELCGQGMDLHPNDPRFPYQLGLLQLAGGQPVVAETQLRESLARVQKVVENPNASRAERRQAEGVRIPARIQLAFSLISQLPTDNPQRKSEIDTEVDATLRDLERLGIYGPALVGRAQQLMAEQKWEEAAKEWNVLANDPQYENWSQMAISMLLNCQIELKNWNELGQVAERAMSRWPGWGPADRAYERYLQATGRNDEVEQWKNRRQQLDPVLALRDRIAEELKRDKKSWNFESIERDLDQMVADPERAGDVRLAQLRLLILRAQGENNRIHDLLLSLQAASPRVVELMVERVEFEVRRRDVPLLRRIQSAASAIDLFRNSYETLPKLEAGVVGPESRLMKALDSEKAPLAGLLRAMLLELKDDLEESQKQFETALQVADGRGLVVQKITDFCLRHESDPRKLNDRFLSILCSTLQRLPPDDARVRAIAALEEWQRRGNIPAEQQLQLARLLVASGQGERGEKEYENLVKQAGRNVLVLIDYAGYLLNLKEPTEKQKARLASLAKQIEVLRPGSLEQRLLDARSLVQAGDAAEAVNRLQTFAGELDQVGTGSLLRSLALFGRADNALNRVVTEEDSDKGALRDLARRLVGDQSPRLPEADYQVLADRPGMSVAVQDEALLLLAETLAGAAQTPAARSILEKTLQKRESPLLALGVATLLARDDKYSEAIALWKQHALGDPDPTARSIQLALLSVRKPELRTELTRFLEEFTDTQDLTVKHAPLILLLAEFKTTPDTIPAAIALYDRLLALAPNAPVTLNNLAYVEAFSLDRREQALEHITKAIDIDQPRIEFIDTRSVVLMQLGRLQEARQDLERITALIPSPLYYLHLAVTQYRLKNTDMATAALRRCRQLKLDPTQLSPLEQLWFNEVRSLYDELGDESASSGD
jgi:tetratricopeptide (TPR) repeat protein